MSARRTFLAAVDGRGPVAAPPVTPAVVPAVVESHNPRAVFLDRVGGKGPETRNA